MAKFSPSKMPQSVMEITTAVCPIVLLKNTKSCCSQHQLYISVQVSHKRNREKKKKKENQSVCIITSLKM